MNNFRIKHLKVQNIGVFENLDLQFQEKTIKDRAEVHLLTGENGTGKTTILTLLAGSILNFNSEEIFKRYRHPDERSFFRIAFSDDTSIDIFSRKGNSVRQGNLHTIEEYTMKWQNYEYNKFDFAFFAYSGYRSIQSHKLPGIQDLKNNPFADSLSFNQTINPAILLQWVANNKAKEAFALAKGEHKRASTYVQSINRIERAISAVIDKEVSFVLNENPIDVFIKIDNEILDFDLLPDGLKSIISWVSDLLMRLDRIPWTNDIDLLDRNFILFLDEIEVHLHPAWQRKILPEIQKLFKNAQIFISTHSPFVVGSVDGAWIYKFKVQHGNATLSEPPILSEDGKSYQLIIKEIFEMDKMFGEQTEQSLNQFYKLKGNILQGDKSKIEDIKKLAKEIASQSIELQNIIGFELKQLSKLTKQEYMI